MAIHLETVVPFGRSLAEYTQFFHLSDPAWDQRILGVGDGPASFNAEATRRGVAVTSVDPIYQFSGEDILARFNTVVDSIIDQIKQTPEDWVWSYHKNPEDLRQSRIQTIHQFVEDYDQGQQADRYLVGALPQLPFADDAYELALCSHFLFLYSDHFDQQFHLDSILEMLRVSPDVRIFPLLTLTLLPSPHLDPIVQQLKSMGYQVAIESVTYELQKGGNKMLRIQR